MLSKTEAYLAVKVMRKQRGNGDPEERDECDQIKHIDFEPILVQTANT